MAAETTLIEGELFGHPDVTWLNPVELRDLSAARVAECIGEHGIMGTRRCLAHALADIKRACVLLRNDIDLAGPDRARLAGDIAVLALSVGDMSICRAAENLRDCLCGNFHAPAAAVEDRLHRLVDGARTRDWEHLLNTA